MYYSSYNKLFWGFIFVFININLGPIDVFPNFIGFFLICAGVTTLVSQHQAFEKAKVPALLLGILSFKDVFKGQPQSFVDTSMLSQNMLWIIYDEIAFITLIYLVFSVSRAIHLLAKERGLEELSERAENRFRAYLITSLVLGFTTPFLLNVSKDWQAGYFILAIIALIVAFFIMGLMRRARNELGNDTEDYGVGR